jgi:3-dehydroquinate synthase class II
MTRVRADFNSVDADGLVRSNRSRADGEIAAGDRVLAYDADGNECEATVADVDVQAGALSLELDVSTWHESTTHAGATVRSRRQAAG